MSIPAVRRSGALWAFIAAIGAFYLMTGLALAIRELALPFARDLESLLTNRTTYFADTPEMILLAVVRREFARENGIAGAVGSDSHRTRELGQAWLEVDDFADRDGFVATLRTGTVNGKLTGQLIHLWTRWDVIRKWFSRRMGA